MENNQSYLANKVSFFNNCKTSLPSGELMIADLFGLIKEDAFSDQCRDYQSLLMQDPQQAAVFKSGKMECITPAGVFSKRHTDNLITPSSLIVLDVDDIPDEKIEKLKVALSSDKYTLAVMDSPGGHGLKVFVLMHFGYGVETYKHRYNEVLKYFANTYSIPIYDKRKKDSISWGLDLACTDVPRLCILGFKIIVNDYAKVFDAYQTFSATETKVQGLVRQICEQQIDITPSYDEWFRIACSLKHEFGEAGGIYFHQVSQFYANYEKKEADQQYSSIHGAHENPVTIKTFFDTCKQYNLFQRAEHADIVALMDTNDDHLQQSSEVKHFPIEVFPTEMRNFLTQASKSVHCPLDYLGVAALMVTSAAVGKKFIISPKPVHTEMANLFAAVVGDPGQKKSPAFKVVMRPIYELEEKYWKEYRVAMQKYKADYERWKTERKENPDLEEPIKPTLKRILTSDITMEALGVLLEENSRGLLCFNDELLGWIEGFNQYKGKGNDRQKFLSLWSGVNIQIDRKQQEPKIIANPFISVTGGIQPDVLKHLANGRNDGFQDRILFCFPERITPRYTRDSVDDVTRELYSNKIFELFERANDEFELNEFRSFQLRFDEEQFDIWEKWIDPHLRETEEPSFPYYLKGPWVKMEAHALRLMLLVAYSRTRADEKVELRTTDVEAGIKLAEYFKTHIRKAYQEMHSSEINKRILRAVEFIKRNGGTTTYRNFYKNGIAECRGPKDAEELFEEMEARGLGQRGKSSAGPGVKRSDIFVLDPAAI